MSGLTHMVVNETLTTMLTELGVVCAHVQKLLGQLEVEGLSNEQAAGVLAELGAEVAHLQAHTEGFQDVINDEIEKL